MKSFIYKIAIFCLPSITCLLLLLTVGKNYFAAYRITNSYSFNEKIRCLPTASEKAILSIGSSMSLNNLYSPKITEYWGSDSYLNTSVWGLSIMDARDLVPVFGDMYHPKTVLCVSNVMDFASPQIEYNFADLSDFIKTRKVRKTRSWFSYCAYYLKHTLKNFLNFNSNHVYTSLSFDKWGGVALASDNFQIKKARWNEKLHFDLINPKSYKALEQISIYLKNRNIKFIFIQSPVREEIKDFVYNENINIHTGHVRQILESNGHVFVDLSHEHYPDSLFVDSAHLNKIGARILTTNVFGSKQNFAKSQ